MWILFTGHFYCMTPSIKYRKEGRGIQKQFSPNFVQTFNIQQLQRILRRKSTLNYVLKCNSEALINFLFADKIKFSPNTVKSSRNSNLRNPFHQC